MQQQIDTNKLLQIIGAKETELTMLREYVSQLEQEKKSQPVKTNSSDMVDETKDKVV